MPDTGDTGVLGALGANVGTPIKRFFVGAPYQERFASDLQSADAVQDPMQRAQAYAAVRDKMFQAGAGPGDTYPILRGRVDKTLFELRQQGLNGEVAATNVERLFGRIGATRPGSVPQYLRLPSQVESDVTAAERNIQQGNLYGQRAETEAQMRPLRKGAEGALIGQRGAAAGASGARQRLAEAQTGEVGKPRPRPLTLNDIFQRKGMLITHLNNADPDTARRIRGELTQLDEDEQSLREQRPAADLQTGQSTLEEAAPAPPQPARPAAPQAPAPAAAQPRGNIIRGPDGSLHRRVDPNAPVPPGYEVVQ